MREDEYFLLYLALKCSNILYRNYENWSTNKGFTCMLDIDIDWFLVAMEIIHDRKVPCFQPLILAC